MITLGNQKPQGKPFAINLAIRNPKNGQVTYKYFEAESGAELHDFWQRHQPVDKKKKKVEEKTDTVKAS